MNAHNAHVHRARDGVVQGDTGQSADRPADVGFANASLCRREQAVVADVHAGVHADRWQQPRRAGGGASAVLTNARVVTRDAMFRGTVHVVDGRIDAIDTGRTSLACAVDLDGDLLIPGLIDIHTDNLERHIEPRPTVRWPCLPALVAHDRQVAAAGITTVFDAMCVGDQQRGRARRQEDLVEALDAMDHARTHGLLKSVHFLHLRCEVSSDGVVDALADLIDDPLVRLVSLMDHTPGRRQWADVAKWRQLNGADISGEELDAILVRRTQIQGDVVAKARREVVRLCQDRGLTLASHDDASAEDVAEALDDGVAIAEFPTTAAAARLAAAAGMRIVMGGPNVVRGLSHSGNVSARDLASEGLVHGLASDYVPTSLMQACFVFHDVLGMALPDAVALVTAQPAAMTGLWDRGQIAIGARADLVAVKGHAQLAMVHGVWRDGHRIV